jgi:hypothetical protein
MRTIKAIIKLVLSVILQLILALPRMVVWVLNLAISLVGIISRTISFLILQFEEELKIQLNGKGIREDSKKN